MRPLIVTVCLLAALPTGVWASTYKCKQPNGSTSFQEQPCAPGAGGEVHIKATPPSEAVAPAPIGKPTRSAKTLPDPGGATPKPDERQLAAQRENEAHNKTVRCNHARQQLEVAKTERPIFSRDNKGERHYVDDKDRAAVVSAAQQRVNAECL